MISYTYVTDIVRHMDELEVLRGALDNVSEGVVLLDGELNAQFLNRKMRSIGAHRGTGRQPSLLCVADREFSAANMA